MKNLINQLLLIGILIAGCCSKSPADHPIRVSIVPRSVNSVDSVVGKSKGRSYIIDYKILTDDYLITSGSAGITNGQTGGLRGPGLVNFPAVHAMGIVARLADSLKDTDTLIIYGKLVHKKDNSEAPYLFGGKQIIFLDSAKYKEVTFEINR